MIHIRESTSCVRVCDSRAYPVFNQSSNGSFPSYTRYLLCLPTGIFYCMPLRKIITQRNFVCLWSKIMRKAILAHYKVFSFKKRPNISLYVEYSRTLIDFSRILSLLIRPLNFYAKWLVRNFGQKHELQYLYKICCVKSGFQILYAVEQFSSLFSKDKLKHGAHIHQTHDPPSPRTSWMYDHCRAVPSGQLSYKCVVWRCYLKHSPRQERDFYTRVFPGHWPMAMPC